MVSILQYKMLRKNKNKDGNNPALKAIHRSRSIYAHRIVTESERTLTLWHLMAFLTPGGRNWN